MFTKKQSYVLRPPHVAFACQVHSNKIQSQALTPKNDGKAFPGWCKIIQRWYVCMYIYIYVYIYNTSYLHAIYFGGANIIMFWTITQLDLCHFPRRRTRSFIRVRSSFSRVGQPDAFATSWPKTSNVLHPSFVDDILHIGLQKISPNMPGSNKQNKNILYHWVSLLESASFRVSSITVGKTRPKRMYHVHWCPAFETSNLRLEVGAQHLPTTGARPRPALNFEKGTPPINWDWPNISNTAIYGLHPFFGGKVKPCPPKLCKYQHLRIWTQTSRSTACSSKKGPGLLFQVHISEFTGGWQPMIGSWNCTAFLRSHHFLHVGPALHPGNFDFFHARQPWGVRHQKHDNWLVVLTCFNHLEKYESQWEGWQPI